jgi:putative membrane protein
MNSMQVGMSEMLDGLNRLSGEGGALSDGAAEMAEGIAAILAGLEEFSVTSADLSELTMASAGIKTGLDGLSAGLAQLQGSFQAYRSSVSESGQDPSALTAANSDTAAALRGTVEELNSRLAVLTPGSQEYMSVSTQVEQTNQLIRLLEANNGLIGAQQQFIDSLESGVGSLSSSSGELAEGYASLDDALQSLPVLLSRLTGGFEQLESGLKELEAGARQLEGGIDRYAAAVSSVAEGYKTLYDGFVRLNGGCGLLKEGVSKLSQGATELSDGLAALEKETSGIDVRVQKGLDEFLSGYGGEGFDNVSFVSEKNKNVKSVQFVMMTPSIRTESERYSPPPAEDEGFIDRLLALFGF